MPLIIDPVDTYIILITNRVMAYKHLSFEHSVEQH